MADRRALCPGLPLDLSTPGGRPLGTGEGRGAAALSLGSGSARDSRAAAPWAPPSRPRRWIPALVLLAALVARSAPAAAQNADAGFVRLADEFLDHWLEARPQAATRLGLHDADGVLRPVTQASLEREAAWTHAFRRRLAAVRSEELSFDRRLEYRVLAARVDRELLDLEVLRPCETDPNAYLSLVACSIQDLLQRDFAPLCARLKAATGRLSQVPEVLRAARINLRDPPRIRTEVAIPRFEGVLRLYRERLPAVAVGCKDPGAQADLAEADSAAVRAVEEFVGFLREDLLARSNGRYALGRETYQRLLACAEMESVSVDSLLTRGRRELAATRVRMEEIAGRIAPGLGVGAALDSLRSDLPAEDQLVPFVAGEVDSIRAFLRARDLVTLPPREHLVVRETPPFRRGLSFASMEPPGVWERRATEAYFDVTPVEPQWSERQKRDHLAFFNRHASEIVAIHEALPGHYAQFLALQKMPSRLRQAFGAGTSTEGWAHYCEQMAIEQGFGDGDPRFELAQQLAALQRIGRLVASLSLHTQGMSIEEAARLFEDQCYLEPINAEREARRAALDPADLDYTLGKWRILELREEVRRRLGSRFSLRQFHDAFLRQGISPLPVARDGVLHDLGLQGSAGRP